MLVFAYGSLLLPESMARTLPGVSIRACVPARCRGMRRTFQVAFPNDGSQTDKAYLDNQGRRPARVLFANVVPGAGDVNGICIPVDAEQLQLLRARERRYSCVELPAVASYPGQVAIAGPVLTFIGKASYTRGADVRLGVVARSYLDSVVNGARFWDRRQPGFWADFQASTDHPPPERTADLRRVDSPGEQPTPHGPSWPPDSQADTPD